MRRILSRIKSKKGFTLIELIAVMVIMAVATAIVLPNIRGMITKTEESMYKSYCVEAATYARGYSNLLTLGETSVPYEKNGATLTYTITNPTYMTKALNEYNLATDFQYYVLDYVEASATTNPISKVREAISKKTLVAKDVMITVIVARDSGGRVPKYVLVGFWYYSYDADNIVYNYYVPSKRGGLGFSKLTSNGK